MCERINRSGCAIKQIKFKGKTMKVAIIGANGKSGSNLVQEALKQGHDVRLSCETKSIKTTR